MHHLLVEFGCWNLLSAAGIQSAANCVIIESQRTDLLPGQQKQMGLKHPYFSTTLTSAYILSNVPSARDPSLHSSNLPSSA